MRTYTDTLRQAHIESGEEGTVSLNSMKHQFTSKAWRDLADEDSELCDFLQKHVSVATD